jgi:Predicted nucleotide kinase (related to CMP and AMP kinases)
LNIAILGTPGVGKSHISLNLSLTFNLNYFNINTLLYYFNLYKGYDNYRKSKIVNISAVKKVLPTLFTSINNSILDSHIDELSLVNFNTIFVVRRNPFSLVCSLSKKYKERHKIKENVEAEVIGLISSSLREKYKDKIKIYDIFSARSIKEFLINPRSFAKKFKGEVDWINYMSKKNLLEKYNKIINSLS